MKSAEYYKNREQTYLKHFFLERYLERVGFIIGFTNDDFVYVDGFSGPWKSTDENFEDTSFMIAIRELQKIKEGLSKVGRSPRIRCLFIEKDERAFRALCQATQSIEGIEVRAMCGEFEQLIPEVLKFVGRSFALFFIDPTGWTGFGLKQITPILRQRGEVIINFMFDHINRFLELPESVYVDQFNDLFGGPGWEESVRSVQRREQAIIDLYLKRMRTAGGFAHVTYARIDKPTIDRTYFYLVYGTRHPKGLMEFRKVEKGFANEQGRVRLTAKQNNRIERTGQSEFFFLADDQCPVPSFEEEREIQLKTAATCMRRILEKKPKTLYEEVLIPLLEMPLVWESDVQAMVMKLRNDGELEISRMGPRERTPKSGHVLIRLSGWKTV
jgi:three-Cys-motif partner protein